MSRYSLHITSQDRVRRDVEGEELPDIETAHAVALGVIWRIQTSSELWAKLLPEARSKMVIEIADKTGRTVLTVPFVVDAGSTH